METKDDTSSNSEKVTIIPEKEPDYKNNDKNDSLNYNKRGDIIYTEQNVRPKDSKTLLNIHSSSNGSEPSSNFPDNYAYKSQQSEV
jgi:hypothetical protein